MNSASGLEGIVAFDTRIAEPDRDGGALRYRGVDIEELVGSVPYELVWGLLVDDSFEPGLALAGEHPLAVRCGDARVDLQAAVEKSTPLTMGFCLDCHRHPEKNLRPLSEITNMAWEPEGAPVEAGEMTRTGAPFTYAAMMPRNPVSIAISTLPEITACSFDAPPSV